MSDPSASVRSIPPDERWWPGVARLVLEIAGVDPAAGPADLRGLVVLVPGMVLAPLLLAALHRALGARAFVAPRILTPAAWAGMAEAPALLRRAELFQALRSSPWVRERFGGQAGALWSLARDIAVLGDELTLAASGAVDAFAGRWRAAVQRHFSQRAALAGEPQSQLVLALWRAGLASDSGAAELRERLARCAREASGPLLWILPGGAAPWQSAFAEFFAATSGQQTCLALSDADALLARAPLLGAAWPELSAAQGATPPAPIAERARGLVLAPIVLAQAAGARLRIFRCQTLEEEASAAAAWAVDRLRAGNGSIALVALDRRSARRVRALLERARVLVADESGWKLSTTSAAAAVMHWIDLVAADFPARALLDWLASPFSPGRAQGTATIAAIAAALRADNVLGGAAAMRSALARRERAGAPDAQAALRSFELLAARSIAWRRSASLGRFLGLLRTDLEFLGMREALAQDPVGARVLEAVDALQETLGASALPLDLAEFRALLAGHFEELGTGNREIRSPVVMTTLAGTRLRRFDCAFLVGVDAEHLPATHGSDGLLSHAVRRDLGLRTRIDGEREQALDLAALLATTPEVAASWCCRRGDETRPLAPLLERLAMVGELAGLDALVTTPLAQLRTVAPGERAPRAPSAPDLLPMRISAGAYQDLIDCPYRFFALRMLGLRKTEQVSLKPDKRDLGLILHAVLLEFHQRRAAQPAADPEAELALLVRLADAQFDARLEQQPTLLGYRERLRAIFPGYLAWMREDESNGWRWSEGEVSLRRDLPVEGAGDRELIGRIDRIDVDAQGRRRIIDYKTGDANALRNAERDPGEQVQLLYYGMLVEPPPQHAAYLALRRPADARETMKDVAKLVPAPEPLAEESAALAARLALDLARVAAGAALPANGAERICRRCELRSLCRHGHVPQAPASGEGAPHE